MVAWQYSTKDAASLGEPYIHLSLICPPTDLVENGWTDWPTLDAIHDAEKPPDTSDRNGTERVRKAATQRRRKPTPLQTARWKAVQKAKRKGLSMRGIARELGIHRDTVKKYMNAESPPMSPSRLTSTKS